MSSGSTLTISQVQVRRMPGISSPFRLDGLHCGITIIYGPNGSGKSTTARALQSLVWPSLAAGERYSVAGQFTLDNTHWTIDVDAGQAIAQRSGVPGEPPDVGPVSHKNRYILTLHDLLHVDDGDFAEYIWRESVGGYDLNAAVSKLGYKSVSPRRGQNHEKLTQVVTQRRERGRLDNELIRAEDRLGQLRTELAETMAAAHQAQLLEQVLAFKDAEAVSDHAKAQVELFPADLERLTGNERKALNHASEELASVQHERAAVLKEIDRLQQAQHAAGPAIPLLTESELAEFHARIQDLQREIVAIEAVTRDLDHLSGIRDTARAQVGSGIPNDSLATIAPDTLRRFAALAAEREQLDAEQAGLRALDTWLGTPQASENSDQLRAGVDLLRRRLRQPVSASGGDSQMRPLALAGGVLLIVAGGAGIYVANVAFAVFIAIGVVLLVLALRKRTTALDDTLVSEFAALGLPLPATWDITDVTRQLGELEAALRKTELASDRLLLLRERDPDRIRVREAEAAWNSAKQAAVAESGMNPDITSAGLALLASRLDAWQSVEAQLQGATAKRAGLLGQRDASLAALNSRFEDFGFSSAKDARDLESQLSQLQARWHDYDRTTQALRDAEQRLVTSLDPTVASRAAEIADIYAAAAIPDADDLLLDARLAQLDAYREAVRTATERAAVTREARLALAGHATLLELDASTLQAQLDQALTTAAHQNRLRDELASIEARVREAKLAQVDTSLIVQQEELESALLNDRARDFRLSAGEVVSAFVRDRTKDLNRPRVFHRAQELLTQITSGAYRLDVNYVGSPTLRAIDTRTNVGHALNELSSGTRVQLLLAVRLAFVESVEHGVRLPLLLDETLANSDERRALEIVRALVTLCENGRQLFYFTAQRDEVAKWESLMQEAGSVPCHTVDLAELRGLAAEQQAPLPAYILPTRVTVAPPGAHTRESYGQLLHVPNVDIWATSPQGVHLWHLVTDLNVLHQLLDRGIGTWGQLQTLVDVSGPQSVNITTSDLRQIEARVHAISAIGSLWRTGRNQHITRQDLEASQAVSETFIERVSALAARYDWEPDLLIDALERGSVPRFRTESTCQLRDYFLREGILSQEDTLSVMELRRRALGQLAVEIEQEYLATHELDALIAQLLPDTSP